jgi:hypothetical protein
LWNKTCQRVLAWCSSTNSSFSDTQLVQHSL